ncbi:hypothetical protein IC582_012275 [Cucumis melo]
MDDAASIFRLSTFSFNPDASKASTIFSFISAFILSISFRSNPSAIFAFNSSIFSPIPSIFMAFSISPLISSFKRCTFSFTSSVGAAALFFTTPMTSKFAVFKTLTSSVLTPSSSSTSSLSIGAPLEMVLSQVSFKCFSFAFVSGGILLLISVLSSSLFFFCSKRLLTMSSF